MRGARSLATLVVLASGCGAGLAGSRDEPSVRGGSLAERPAARVLLAPKAGPQGANLAVRRVGRMPLGDAATEALDLELLAVQHGHSLLLVSQRADERAAFVRRLDGSTGRVGPLLALVDEHVLGAFDAGDDRFTLLTTTGEKLCVASYVVDNAAPYTRGCAAVRPAAIAAVGERLALLEVAVATPPPAPGRVPAATATTKRKTPSKPTRAKPASSHRKVSGAAKSRRVETAPRGPSPKVKVEVRLRWATREGVFEDDAAPTGLEFRRPLDGMTLIDAAGRAGGIDLLWYEAVPKPARPTALGSADLMWGSLKPDGKLDPASRVAVAGGPLEYGWIRGQDAPRLLSTEAGSAVLTLSERERACQVVRVAPERARLTPEHALCALDPFRLASPSPPPASEIAALGRLLAREPRRVVGQPQGDVGLAAWAGERAYFLEGSTLRSVSRDGSELRDEPAPFPARRTRIAWSALASDGEGVALAGGRLYHLSASGDLADGGPLFAAFTPSPRSAAANAARAASAPLSEPDPPGAGRSQLARIGHAWFLARGDVVRLGAEPTALPALRGRAQPDVSVLVGGARRGLFLALEGGNLRVQALDANGRIGPFTPENKVDRSVAAPVRPGFDAIARGAGGALVAGVRPGEPPKVVAFAIDEDGHVGARHETSLPVRPGELTVRLVSLPRGGGVLADAERRHAVWLDDDGSELASAPWPVETSDAACLDGSPARVSVPAPEPGHFLRVAALADPGTCVVGDVAWATDGTLRWFGSDARGLDSIAEVGLHRVAPPFATPALALRPVLDASVPATSSSPCPPEMVSISGRFCVDRFEATLFDAGSGRPLSPDWPTTPALVDRVLEAWSTQRERVGDVFARALPLPWLAPWQRTATPAPIAVSRLGVRPNGYVTGIVAAAACSAAGKRLCTHDEFVTACRGEADTQFPYGDDYEAGVCNVFREDHPAARLHGSASVGHLDPRLNRVDGSNGEPLLRATGATPACRSRWAADAVYDLVGNLDEWVDEPGGAFAGGFYSRSTRSGCDALVTNHPPAYLDYSTGVRCCRDASK